MSVDYVIDILRDAAVEAGYKFLHKHADLIPAIIPQQKTLWIKPLILSATEGLQECMDSYALSGYLFDGENDFKGKGGYGALGADLSNLLRKSGRQMGVRRVYNIEITPGLKPLTVCGRTYICFDALLELFYYKNPESL